MNPDMVGLIELVLVFVAVFGVLGWQYWSLRDRPAPDDDDKKPPSAVP